LSNTHRREINGKNKNKIFLCEVSGKYAKRCPLESSCGWQGFPQRRLLLVRCKLEVHARIRKIEHVEIVLADKYTNKNK
jgi:hypothetical protein